MIKLKHLLPDLLTEDGASAGNMEIVSTSLEKAREYAEKQFIKAGTTLEKEIPDFDKNFKAVQSKAKMGHTKRKDMPVIEKSDVQELQRRLSKGYIDIEKPLAKDTNNKNPFPKGLTGAKAEQWLKNGLHKYDGDESDDIVKVSRKTIPVQKLKPIQKQIYFDKSMNVIAKLGVTASKKYMQTQTFIVSNDNFIIDGHHRFQSMMIEDPSMSTNALSIDLPLSKLLPMSLSYSDAIGNKRNA